MSDSPQEPEDERKIREDRQLIAEQQERYFEMLADVSDTELVATAPGTPGAGHEMEMQRRLKSAVFALTAEIVTSRESSERLTSKLDASIADLTGEIVTFRTSSDKAAGKLARLTWVIIGLTVVIAGLTVVLVILAVRGGQASPAPTRSHAAHSVTPIPSEKSATAL